MLTYINSIHFLDSCTNSCMPIPILVVILFYNYIIYDITVCVSHRSNIWNWSRSSDRTISPRMSTYPRRKKYWSPTKAQRRNYYKCPATQGQFIFPLGLSLKGYKNIKDYTINQNKNDIIYYRLYFLRSWFISKRLMVN